MFAAILLRVKFVDILWALFAIIVLFGHTILLIILAILGDGPSSDDTSNNDWSESFSDRMEYEHKKDIEDKRSTIRSERKYMTDEEIRDKHRGIWDSSDTEQAFKEEDGPHSFIDWLLFH